MGKITASLVLILLVVAIIFLNGYSVVGIGNPPKKEDEVYKSRKF
jgi:hypothetical protein